jgi:hypothetical protein
MLVAPDDDTFRAVIDPKPEAHKMNRTISVVTGTLVIASAIVPAVIAEAPMRTTAVVVAPGPGPEHARLTAMSGTWDVELSFWFQPGRPAVVSKGVSTIRSLFDGSFIEEKIDGVLNGVPFTTLAWTGYNTSTHQYEATRIASTNTIQISEAGAWDETARHFELKGSYNMAGETWTQRTVIEPTSANSMVAASYLSFGKIPEWKAVEIRYTRR